MAEEIKGQNMVINGPLVATPPASTTSSIEIKEVPSIKIEIDDGVDPIAVLSFVITAFIVVASTWMTVRHYQKTLKSQKEVENAKLELEKTKTRVEILSKNRQDWINNLRDTLAEYVAANLSMVELFKLSEQVRADSLLAGEKGVNVNLVEINFKLQHERTNATRLMSKIALLSNPTEPDFITLLNAVNLLKNASDGGAASVKDECNALISISQKILKIEWERVKKVE